MIRKTILLKGCYLCLILLALFVFASAESLQAQINCDPRSYGAKADNIANDTAAIQAAIDTCERKGGGIVRLSAGTYRSAPIVLKNNVTLHLDKGAELPELLQLLHAHLVQALGSWTQKHKTWLRRRLGKPSTNEQWGDNI